MSGGLRADSPDWFMPASAEHSLVLLFDYDGTLVPIVEHPSLAALSADTQHQLEQLALTPSIAIGVLSGRAIDDLRDRVGIEGAYYVGTSGLELSYGRSHRRIQRPEPARAALAAALPIRRALADTPVPGWNKSRSA